ncbi:hypothetical protein, partial [Stenotrophomonas sp. GbtcB23]|uniref:hypothetical protein n=1 Tax=Stenotrophomonas sp. GbtcB23 TaxID=2824768 RepID=UPI001C302997
WLARLKPSQAAGYDPVHEPADAYQCNAKIIILNVLKQVGLLSIQPFVDSLERLGDMGQGRGSKSDGLIDLPDRTHSAI